MKRLVLIGAAAVMVVCSGTFVSAKERAGENRLPSFMEIFSSLNEDENSGKIRDTDIVDPFTRAKLPGGVDYKANNFEALTEYFDKNIEGFDKDNYKIVSIAERSQSLDDYQILYKLYHKGYQTRYGFLIIARPEEGLKYSSSINEFDMEKADSLNIPDSSEITEDQIKTAKEKAVANYREYAVLEQDVKLVLNRNYKRVIEVSTILAYKDENGNVYEGDKGFKEIYLYFVDEGYGEEFDGTNY